MDQNTDRMWFTIGVALVSVFVLLFINDVYPNVFAGVMDGAKDKTVVEYVEPEPGVTVVEIPYEIDYTEDPSKVRKGTKGLKNVFDNGAPDEIVKKPINRIALYPYEKQELAFSTRYVDNRDKPQGYTHVKQEGVPGIEYYFIDPPTGKRVSKYMDLTQAPVDKIVERGTAPIVTIPFITRYTLDSSQVHAGKNGEKYTDSKGKEHILKEAVDNVVLYSSREESIPFTTVRRENRDLPKGQERVVNEGREGKKTVFHHPDTNAIVKEQVTTHPVSKIIEYGTRQTSTIAFKTEYTMDDKKVRKGQLGQKYVYSDGTEKVAKQPVSEIKKYPYNLRTIGFDTRYTENRDLYKYQNEQVVAKDGVYGQKREYFDPVTGKVVQSVVLKQPQTKEVHTGWIPLNRKTHVVKAGDALYGLSNKYNTTISQLQSWNRLGGSTHIEIGWRIIVAW